MDCIMMIGFLADSTWAQSSGFLFFLGGGGWKASVQNHLASQGPSNPGIM